MNIHSSNFLRHIDNTSIADDAQIRLKSPAPGASSTTKTNTPNASIGRFSIQSFFFPEKNNFYKAKLKIKEEFVAACPDKQSQDAMALAFDQKFFSFSERHFGDFFGTTALTMKDVRAFDKSQKHLYGSTSVARKTVIMAELPSSLPNKDSGEYIPTEQTSDAYLPSSHVVLDKNPVNSDDETASITSSEVSHDNNKFVHVQAPAIDSGYEFVTAEEEKYQPPSLLKGLSNITSAIFSVGSLFSWGGASEATYTNNRTGEEVQVPKKGTWKIDLTDSNNQQIINGNLQSLIERPDPDGFFRDAGRTFNYTLAGSPELTTVGIEEIEGGLDDEAKRNHPKILKAEAVINAVAARLFPENEKAAQALAALLRGFCHQGITAGPNKVFAEPNDFSQDPLDLIDGNPPQGTYFAPGGFNGNLAFDVNPKKREISMNLNGLLRSNELTQSSSLISAEHQNLHSEKHSTQNNLSMAMLAKVDDSGQITSLTCQSATGTWEIKDPVAAAD